MENDSTHKCPDCTARHVEGEDFKHDETVVDHKGVPNDSQCHSGFFELFDGIKPAVFAFEPIGAVTLLKSRTQQSRQSSCDRACVRKYSELSLFSRQA